MADEEFIRIRQHLANYNSQIQLKLESTNENVLIDKITVRTLLENKKTIIQVIDNEISQGAAGGTLKDLNDDFLDKRIERLKFLGFNTLDEFLNSLERYKGKIVDFVKNWTSGKPTSFSQGICFFYLGYIVLAEKNDRKTFIDYLETFKIGDNDKDRLYRRIMHTYNIVK